MRALTILLLSLLAIAPAGAITLQEAQAEVDAWAAPLLAGWASDFTTCVTTKALSDCHPVASSTVLANTAPADPSAAVQTNDDPGVFVPNVCDPACYDDTRGAWAIAAVDIPATGPAQLQANLFVAPGGVISVQLVTRISYDGVIWERGYSVYGAAPTFGWQEVPIP